ncbi:MAG: OmpA family protein [Flavobacteriales bacterium]
MKKTHTLVLFFAFISLNLYAQSNLTLGNLYFNRASYPEAAKHLLNVEDKNQDVLQSLGDCYYYNFEMEEAKTWYETLFKTYRKSVSPDYYFRYAQALYATGEEKNGTIWLNNYKQAKNQTSDVEYLSAEYVDLKATNNTYTIRRLSTELNTEHTEFGGAFYTPDTLVFTSSKRKGSKTYPWNNENYLDLYQARVSKNGALENIQPFSKDINTALHESNAVFTKDGKTVYFTGNNRSWKKKTADKHGINYLKIYKATKVDGNWENISPLSINVDYYITEHPALNKAEDKLYFASDRPGTLGSLDLYVVDIHSDGTFGTPINLGPTINTEKREQFPFVSQKNELYFSSNGHLGLGGLDIFKSTIASNTYSTPQNLQKTINSIADDFAYVEHKSKTFGYFSSNRTGNDDLFTFKKSQKYSDIVLTIKDEATGENIKDALVSLWVDGSKTMETKVRDVKTVLKTLYVPNKTYKLVTDHKAYQPQTTTLTKSQILGQSPTTIYLKPEQQALASSTIQLELRDSITDDVIDQALLTLLANGEELSATRTTQTINRVPVFYDPQNTYTIIASHHLYEPVVVTLTPQQLMGEERVVIYAHGYVDKEERIVLKNNKHQIDHEPILFDLNSSYLTSEAIVILDDIVSILLKYPDLNIRCESHTDARETKKYNQWLSDRRAARTADYIVSKGISKSRITKAGYGESQILNGCTDGVKCSEEAHQLNRRTEFVLTEN